MQSPRSGIQQLQNPYTLSLNPPPPGQYQPYNYHSSLPTTTIDLPDSPNYARNHKSRLYQADPSQDIAKQRVQEQYREELQRQIDEDRQRKAARKAKEAAEDEKLERQFYDNMKIEAQSKGKKEEPNYFLMRTLRGKSQKQKQDNFAENKSELLSKSRTEERAATPKDTPKIIKRGGYHNQSSLGQADKNKQNEEQHNPESEERTPRRQLKSRDRAKEDSRNESEVEQERISNLLLFQQNMLRKLDYFRKEILTTSQSLHLDEELEKVRLKLRAKPLNLEKVHSLNPREGLDDVMQNQSEFYHLPLISSRSRPVESDREVKKKRDRDREREREEK
jgi:hypothetical protein